MEELERIYCKLECDDLWTVLDIKTMNENQIKNIQNITLGNMPLSSFERENLIKRRKYLIDKLTK